MYNVYTNVFCVQLSNFKKMKTYIMRKLLILPIIISLTGCYQQVNNFDISRSIYACDNKLDNIVAINSHVTGYEEVLCKDGKWRNLVNVSLPTN